MPLVRGLVAEKARTVERCRPEESRRDSKAVSTPGGTEGRRDADLRPRRREALKRRRSLRSCGQRGAAPAPYSGPGLAGSTPRPAPSGDLQRVLASMQSSWGARRRLPAPPATEHARPRREGRAARLREGERLTHGRTWSPPSQWSLISGLWPLKPIPQGSNPGSGT